MHVGVILVLALTATIRFFPLLSAQGPRLDERVYLRAFQAVSAGESPYALETDQLGFYYPPPFAVLGATALQTTDPRAVVIGMRAANVLGLACCLWCAFQFLPLARRWSLAAAMLYIALAPEAVVHGFGSGNLSFAVIGASLVALAAWRSSAVFAGVLLTLGTVIKPIAAVGLSTLAAHRPSQGGRQHLWAAATALTLAGTLTLASPFLIEYLSLGGHVDVWPLGRSVSLHRWLRLTGLEVPPAVLLLLVALATAWLARRGPIGPRQLSVLAILGMTLAAPALWNHSLLLTLPLQTMALAKVWQRLRSRTPAVSRFARYELALVVLAVMALQFADGIGGGLETAAVPLQLLGLAVPVFAPAGLALYVWRQEPGRVVEGPR